MGSDIAMVDQLDYIFFVYGLAFLILGVTLRNRGDSLPHALAWPWLAGFSLLHGLCEWLDLLALSLGDSPLFSGCRLLAMAASFLALLEFGRRGLPERYRFRYLRWGLAGVAGVASFGLWGGLSGLNAACRYVLAFPGAALAGAALWREGRATRTGPRWPWQLMAAAFGVYAVAAGLIPPKTSLWPANVLNHNSFLQWTGFPIQLVRAGCALTAALGCWWTGQPNRSRADASARWFRWALPGLLSALVAVGLWTTQWQGQVVAAQQQEALIQQATAIARTLDPAWAKTLSFTPRDRDHPEFDPLQRGLIAYARLLRFESVFTLALRQEQPVYGQLGFQLDDPAKQESGALDLRSSPELLGVFRTGQAQTLGPYEVRGSLRAAAFAPVTDPRQGNVLLVVGVEKDAKSWRQSVAWARLTQILTGILLSSVLLGGILGRQRREVLSSQSKPRNRRLETALVAAVGLIITANATWLVLQSEMHTRRMEYARLARVQIGALAEEMTTLRDHLLLGVAGALELAPDITRDQFGALVGPLLNRHAIATVGWAPAVRAASRSAFEARLRRTDRPDFTVFGLDTEGRRQTVPDGRDCYPIVYAEPLAEVAGAIGLDIASSPARWAAAAEAIRTGRPVASELVSQASEPLHRAMIVYLPVFDPAPLPRTPGDTRDGRSARGVLFVSLRLDRLLGTALRTAQGQNSGRLDLHQLSPTSPPAWLSSTDASASPAPTPATSASASALEETAPLFMFGRAFAVTHRASARFAAIRWLRATVLAGLGGSLLTVTLAALVATFGRRRDALDTLVWERTTELTLANQRLRETLATLRQFSRVVEQSPAAIVITDRAGNLTFVNRAFCQVTGYAEEEVLGNNPRLLKSGSMPPEVYQDLWRTIGGGEVWRGELENRKKDGELYWEMAVISPLIDETGQITHYIGIKENITERKRAEDAARRKAALDAATSELSLQLLEPATKPEPMAAIVLRHARRLTGSAHGFVAAIDPVTGRARIPSLDPSLPETLESWPISDFAIQRQPDGRYRGLWGESLNRREPQRWAAKEAMPAGLSGISNLLTVPVVVGGDLLGQIALANAPRGYRPEDVESVKSLARLWGLYLLRASEQRFRTMADWAYDWEMWNDPRMQFLYVSPSVERITGYGTAEFFQDAHLLNRIVHPEDSERWLNHAHHTLQDRHDIGEIEFRILTKKGQVRWIGHVCRPVIGTDGTFLGRRSTNRDITERKLAEQERERLQSQLLHAQKMESIGLLAGGVAHDFNNILGAIILGAELLRARPSLDPAVREGLRDLEKEAQRAADLTRQLLVFSRRQAMKPQRLNLNDVLAGLMKMLRRLLGEHLEIVVSLPQTPLWVDADGGMLEQVVVNLCVNARDAMPKGGKLTLALAQTVVDVAAAERHPDARPGAFVCLSVADNGCGMSEAVLKRIFEPFFTTKELGKGTGLGLATVYGIVSQHQGWVQAESQVGAGTTFQVYLPSAVAPEVEAPARTGSTPVIGGRETILLVEDEPSVRRLAALSLRHHGYQVLEAAQADEALRVWKEHGSRIDLLFTDMVMPQGMSGLELAERLRTERPHLPVIVSSGYSAELADPSGPGARNHLNLAYLPKPTTPAVLARTVRECLDGRGSPPTPA